MVGSVAWGWGPLGILSQGMQVELITAPFCLKSEVSPFDKWLVCSGNHLPPVWTSRLLTVQILRKGFSSLQICQCVGEGSGKHPCRWSLTRASLPSFIFQSSATLLRCMWFLLCNQIPTKHLSLNLCFYNTCFIVKTDFNRVLQMQCNFHVLVGLSFISLLFVLGFLSLFLVARALNTWESSLVVSVIQQFSE